MSASRQVGFFKKHRFKISASAAFLLSLAAVIELGIYLSDTEEHRTWPKWMFITTALALLSGYAAHRFRKADEREKTARELAEYALANAGTFSKFTSSSPEDLRSTDVSDAPPSEADRTKDLIQSGPVQPGLFGNVSLTVAAPPAVEMQVFAFPSSPQRAQQSSLSGDDADVDDRDDDQGSTVSGHATPSTSRNHRSNGKNGGDTSYSAVSQADDDDDDDRSVSQGGGSVVADDDRHSVVSQGAANKGGANHSSDHDSDNDSIRNGYAGGGAQPVAAAQPSPSRFGFVGTLFNQGTNLAYAAASGVSRWWYKDDGKRPVFHPVPQQQQAAPAAAAASAPQPSSV